MIQDHDEFAGKAFADPEVREGYRKAAEQRGRRQALIEAYWKLLDHADGLRDTETYRRFMRDRADESLPSQLRDSADRAIRAVRGKCRGLEAGARDLAGMLGVPEHEIERPLGTSEVTDGR